MVARTTMTLDFRRLRWSFHSRPTTTRTRGARGDRSADIGETLLEGEKRGEKRWKRGPRCRAVAWPSRRR